MYRIVTLQYVCLQEAFLRLWRYTWNVYSKIWRKIKFPRKFSNFLIVWKLWLRRICKRLMRSKEHVFWILDEHCTSSDVSKVVFTYTAQHTAELSSPDIHIRADIYLLHSLYFIWQHGWEQMYYFLKNAFAIVTYLHSALHIFIQAYFFFIVVSVLYFMTFWIFFGSFDSYRHESTYRDFVVA